jgi:hypothetical protein
MRSEFRAHPSGSSRRVRHEIRGRRAHELERQGYRIIALDSGDHAIKITR